MSIKRVRTDCSTGAEEVTYLRSFRDLPEDARRLIDDLLWDDYRRGFYQGMIERGEDFPLCLVYVGDQRDQRPLTEEEAAWAQKAFGDFEQSQAAGEGPSSVIRHEQGEPGEGTQPNDLLAAGAGGVAD